MNDAWFKNFSQARNLVKYRLEQAVWAFGALTLSVILFAYNDRVDALIGAEFSIFLQCISILAFGVLLTGSIMPIIGKSNDSGKSQYQQTQTSIFGPPVVSTQPLLPPRGSISSPIKVRASSRSRRLDKGAAPHLFDDNFSMGAALSRSPDIHGAQYDQSHEFSGRIAGIEDMSRAKSRLSQSPVGAAQHYSPSLSSPLDRATNIGPGSLPGGNVALSKGWASGLGRPASFQHTQYHERYVSCFPRDGTIEHGYYLNQAAFELINSILLITFKF